MKRLDRQGVYTIPIWFGLFLSGIYVLWVPRVDPLISERLEDRLAVVMIVGSLLCLVGVAIKDRITAYKLEFVGLFLTFVVLGYLAAHVDRSLIQQWTLAGGMGALIQIGSVRMMVQIAREILADRSQQLAVKQATEDKE